MKKSALLFCSSMLGFASYAQVTWSEDIADIVYENCTMCHRSGGIGPFSLLTYEDASSNGWGIDDAVLTGYMPPWFADVEYQHYTEERILEPNEIAALVEWVNNGFPQGDPETAPPPPAYPEDGFVGLPPDLEVQIPTYASQATPWADDYVCFSIPLELTQTKKLRGFEVIPGNAQIVHHALLYIDESGTYPTDTNGLCVGPTDGLIGGYTPGALPTVFPSNGQDINMGVTIPAGSNLVLAMHYPEGSAGEVDDTRVRLFFYDDATPIREVQTDPIIQNWSFSLPANNVTDVSATFNLIPLDFSLLSVFPHMHLLGKNITSYAVSPQQDTIPLVHIPHWDFEWQQFYFFQNIQVIPAWSTIYGEGSFDNTASNPHNPNDPPIMVTAGLNTTDEMFLVYFHYLPYEEGDELLDLNEMTTLPMNVGEHHVPGTLVQVLPNPFEEEVQFEIQRRTPGNVSLYIYSMNGALVERVVRNQPIGSGSTVISWKPESHLPNGNYLYSIAIDGDFSSGIIVRK
ncbi:MAG: T9SS type A sorting domain-containing protein [Flavobacteriales bacterium]|nr:T9SS type A sorting domain-containing protein [Flavobacteriales bacterium]